MTMQEMMLLLATRIVAKVDQLLSQCDELSAKLQDQQATTEQLLTATIHHLLNDLNT